MKVINRFYVVVFSPESTIKQKLKFQSNNALSSFNNVVSFAYLIHCIERIASSLKQLNLKMAGCVEDDMFVFWVVVFCGPFPCVKIWREKNDHCFLGGAITNTDGTDGLR